MDILNTPAVQGFIRLCDEGWRQGWHERNGGNLSYRLSEEDRAALVPLCPEEGAGEWAEIGAAVPALGGAWFLVTGSGKYFQNVSRDPADSLAVIELDAAGERYRVRWGLTGGGRPTSELPTHMMNHAVKLETTGGAHRVIYHCHPINLIALTFVLPLDDRTFTRELWETMTECPIVFPAGVGVLPWMVPGGREIAVASCEKMRRYDVLVWAHHGLFCSGTDFDTTFGLAHTVEKAAAIAVKVRSMVTARRQTISSDDLRTLARAFGVQLNDEFLN